MADVRTWRDDFTIQRVIGFVISVIVAALVLPLAEATAPEAQALTARIATQKASPSMREATMPDGWPDAEPATVHVAYTGPDHLRAAVFEELRHGTLRFVDQPDADHHFVATASISDDNVTVELHPAGWTKPDAEGADDDAPTFEPASVRVGGWEAVLPPLMAILIALFFRRLLLALGAAVWLGATVSSGWNPLMGVWTGVTEFVWGSVGDTFNLYIIGFTLSLVGMVQVITRMGGIAGLLDSFRKFTATARSARVTTAALGTAIFFDDYANTIVVGTSMRPITDARGISREKLAYLVDSMSAPIAGVAIISTWVGYEVGLFGELSQQLGLGRSGYDIFFTIIPMRFYCLMTLVFVLANAWTGRDFGPMRRAEQRAARGEVMRAGSQPLTSKAFSAAEPAPGIDHRWYNAVLPVGFVIVATLLGMFWSGWSSADASIPALFGGDVLAGWSAAAADLASWAAWRDAFGGADSAKVLFYAAIGGTLVAIGLAVGQRLLSPVEAVKAFAQTIPTMWLAVAILVLAWSIRAVCDDLGTSIFLVGAVQDLVTPAVLPILTFLLAAVVAFATGTSWGTMGILLPAMVPLAFYLTEGDAGSNTILMLCFAAVLDGAIYGDHCSPISDTTVMSSISSSCDHIDHVRTQFPYATTTMAAAGLFGYVGMALGLSNGLALVLGAVSVVAVLFLVGRPIERPPAADLVVDPKS